MASKFRVVAVILFACSLGLALGCKSSAPQAEAIAPPEVESTPAPEPTPDVDEAMVTDPGTQAIVSEQPTVESLPADLVSLNARGYLEDVFFETDSYVIGPSSRDHLAANASWLSTYPSIVILIEGHCDERNTREYNLALGERRASAVRDYLVFLGIDPERIRTISYGEERPFATGHSESAWSQNRRAHFVITAR